MLSLFGASNKLVAVDLQTIIGLLFWIYIPVEVEGAAAGRLVELERRLSEGSQWLA